MIDWIMHIFGMCPDHSNHVNIGDMLTNNPLMLMYHYFIAQTQLWWMKVKGLFR